MNKYNVLAFSVKAAIVGAGVYAFTPAMANENEDVSKAERAANTEVIEITATRRSQSLKNVPLSVSAFSQQLLDKQGLKEVDDLVQFTPGLSINRGGNGSNTIAIRGISSDAGAGTTGIYIDDTPIQARNLGYAANSAFPALFDLQRVEILRGPQGTLFGAGSQGGTVRFIQAEPDVYDTSVYARGEYATTDGGAASYEGGVAVGVPIIEGELGMRLSVFQREDGGWIDTITADPVITDLTGDAGPDSLTFSNQNVVEENSNGLTTQNFRVALKWQPTDSIQITPSVYYQNQERDNAFNQFYLSASDDGDYARLAHVGGDGDEYIDIEWPDLDSGEDKFTLSAVNVTWDLGDVELYSTTSYFDRDFYQYSDMTEYYAWWYGIQDEQSLLAPQGQKAVSKSAITQETFTQEVRLQSTGAGPLRWVAGFFYSDADQHTTQDIRLNSMNNATSIKRFYLPDFLASVDNGAPYGEGFSAYQNHFGVNPDPYGHEWGLALNTIDKQYAVFGQIDYDITEKLTLTAGLRVAKNDQESVSEYSGGTNNLNAPVNNLGAAEYAPFNTPEYVSSSGENSETSVTPKFSASYKFDRNNMAYATVAKGFRPAGVSKRLVGICDADLISLGYEDADGKPSNPTTYNSDTVWSYEIGSKNSLFDNNLFIDSSAYVLDWNDIQSTVMLNSCLEGFTANLGKAQSKGFDVAIRYSVTPDFQLSGTLGYNDTTYSNDALSQGGVILVSEGSSVAGAVTPWMASLSGQYFYQIMDRYEGYLRADLAYRSEQSEQGTTDPDNPRYNPDLSPTPNYTTVNVRAGVQIDNYDVSLFIDNLTNQDVLFNAANSSVFTGGSRQVWTASTIRPRTIGLFVSYRY